MSAAEAAAYSSNNIGTLPTLNMFSADKFRAFTNQVTSQVTPFAARSQQWIKEQTGSVGEKTELPHDYLELEVRVDALKATHQKLLAATSLESALFAGFTAGAIIAARRLRASPPR